MKKTPKEDNLILNLSFDFAVKIVQYCELLEADRKYVLARQLLKSGTSIGANVREAQNPESKNDFIHKMKIAAKEAEETEFWLELCDKSPNYPDAKELYNRNRSIILVLNKIIGTSKRNFPI